MFRIRGKTNKGDSVTGQSAAATFEAAAKEAESTAKAGGATLVQLSIRTLEGGAGLKIAKPRKR